MSNPIKSSECIYPECGPTCRRDCPPLPAKPIEPTEEQKQAAASLFKFQTSDVDVDDLARLLAEREAKLQAEIARLEALCTEEARLIVERDTLRARVAELEADASTLAIEWAKIEGQHLADIKALMAKMRVAERMRKLVVRVVCSPSTSAGVVVPMHLVEALDALNRDEADFADVLTHLAHYDDAKADAPASTEGRCAMSEPVIKAAQWMCPVCGRSEPRRFVQHVSPMVVWCIVDAEPLYTRDDLVRAVAFSISETSSMSLLDVQSFAENTVDRLTKGDV